MGPIRYAERVNARSYLRFGGLWGSLSPKTPRGHQRSGTSYERFLRREFFDPLDLRRTGYRLADWSGVRIATGYRGDRRFGRVTG